VRIYESPALGAWWPAMAASPDGQTLHLVWQEWAGSERETNYIRGTVSGSSVSWSTTPTKLSTGHSQAILPDVAVDPDGNVHVVWAEVVGAGWGEQYVRYTRLNAGSGSWLPSQRIDPISVAANGIAPSYVSAHVATWKDVESGETTVCVAWHGIKQQDPPVDAEEALLTCSLDGGNNWLRTQNMSRSTTPAGSEISIRPDIVFDSSGNLHVVWQEYSGGASGSIPDDYEIYYASGGIGAGPVYLPLIMKNH
jgi:hypothetical protein